MKKIEPIIVAVNNIYWESPERVIRGVISVHIDIVKNKIRVATNIGTEEFPIIGTSIRQTTEEDPHGESSNTSTGRLAFYGFFEDKISRRVELAKPKTNLKIVN